MLNLQHLQTFVAVIKTGSFSEASRELGYTPSAVSQQIAQLERDVKAVLFERHARSIRPTGPAEHLARQAEGLLESVAQLEEQVRAIDAGQAGRIRVGSFPAVSARILPAALSSFSRAHSEVEILVEEGEPDQLLELLVNRDLDVTLVYSYDLVLPDWPALLTETPLFDEDLLVLVSEDHRLAARDGVNLEDLRDEIWVETRQGTNASTCLTAACATVGFHPKINLRSRSYEVRQRLVAHGFGIALVPALSYQTSILGTKALPLTDMTLQRHVSMLHRRDTLLVNALIREFQKATSQIDTLGVHHRPTLLPSR